MKKTLKKYLTINSAFSAFSGLTMLLFSNVLNNFFGINNAYIFPFIGANLLIFSIIVRYVANKQLSNQLLVNIISALDGFWVIGSIIIVLFQIFNLTTNGYILISAVALWIGFLGYKQFTNNK